MDSPELINFWSCFIGYSFSCYWYLLNVSFMNSSLLFLQKCFQLAFCENGDHIIKDVNISFISGVWLVPVLCVAVLSTTPTTSAYLLTCSYVSADVVIYKLWPLSNCYLYSSLLFTIWINDDLYSQGHNNKDRFVGLLPDTWNSGLRMRRERRECFPRHQLQRKLLVSDPGMHHGTCVTHVPWCMLGSPTRGGGENVPAFPAHAQPAILHICQKAHGQVCPMLKLIFLMI